MDRRVALVLETNNLAGGGAGADRVAESLSRLLRHLRKQTAPISELVVTHCRLTPQQRARLEEDAEREIRFVRVGEDTGYYQAKNLGFAATTAGIVAFGDADCWPEREWLKRLVAPLEEDAPDAPQVACGRTTYRGDLLGIAATAIDFMYFESPLGEHCVRNFYANNVAFRREVFAANCYQPADGIYRGHCQVLGLRLQAQRVRVRFVPLARTIHRFPDTAREFLRLRWLRGHDAVELTPHLADAYLPPRLRFVGRVPLASVGMLAIRFAYSLRALGRQDMPALNGFRSLACAGFVAALSAVDAGGALHRSVSSGGSRAPADVESLSYHR